MFDALPPPSLTLLFNALQHLVLQYLAIPVDTLSVMLCDTFLDPAIPSIVPRYCKCNSFIT
jgi:hypothetical protein